MRLVLISDTHDQHAQLGSLLEGNILVHAGDLTGAGDVLHVQAALDWLNAQPFEHIVVVAGNHDFAFERPAKKAKLNLGRIHYLENSGCEIEGLKFWGSPVTPWFYDWAFNVQRGPDIRQYWDRIPCDTSVLITHGPPFGILDQSVLGKSDHLGCADLAEVVKKVMPRLHVFGHIHGGRGMQVAGGTLFVNASAVDEAYKIVPEKSIYVDLWKQPARQSKEGGI